MIKLAYNNRQRDNISVLSLFVFEEHTYIEIGLYLCLNLCI